MLLSRAVQGVSLFESDPIRIDRLRQHTNRREHPPRELTDRIRWSERRDSNPRPPVPQTDALPGCATLRPCVAVPYQHSARAAIRLMHGSPGVSGRTAHIPDMIAFADLLERLVFTPSRNAKIALLRRYFATQGDPDRGIGLAAITGALTFTAAKPGLIRELVAARVDPVLFEWSYDYVGDLA